MKPHLNYVDIIYDQAYNTSFHQDIKSIQYSTSLSITSAVRGTSREKLYQELGFKSLRQRRWYRKLCCLFKIINKESPSYLFQLVPSSSNKQDILHETRKIFPNFVKKTWLFWKLLFLLDYKRVEQSGPVYQKIQKH